MDSSSIGMILLIVLLVLTAFFVASEFSLVKIRRTRVEQLVSEGDKRAKRVKKILDNLDGYLSACQLGITITSLGIGWVGEPAVAKLLQPVFAQIGIPDTLVHTIAFVIAFSLITFFHVVFGELAPKTVAIRKTETVAFMLSGALILFYRIMYPIIWVLNGSANSLVRLFGLKPASEEDGEHTAAEVKMIVSNSQNLEPDEQKMLTKIFDFHERFLREIMVHRKDMECIFLSDKLEENLQFIKGSSHSRFPVCGEDKDDILGYITVKDIYRAREEGFVDIAILIREIPKLYETYSIKKALRMMQESKYQLAIVVDEYGGVSGLVTLEDIVEVIVGEIQDEFDNETESFAETKDGTLVDGSVLIDDVNEQLAIDLEEIDGIDTIGGYILTKIEETPRIGMEVELSKFKVIIEKIDGHRIISLLFIKKIASEETIEKKLQ